MKMVPDNIRKYKGKHPTCRHAVLRPTLPKLECLTHLSAPTTGISTQKNVKLGAHPRKITSTCHPSPYSTFL